MKLVDVIDIIQPNETYISRRKGSRIKEITLENGALIFKCNADEKYDKFGIYLDELFDLKRKEYSFEDAYREMLNGKIIESIDSGTKTKFENNTFYQLLSSQKEWWKADVPFVSDEMINKFYVID